METLALLNAAPSTYVDIQNFVYKAKQELLSGEYNPLDIEIQLKAMEELIKMLRGDSDIKNAAIKEAEKYGKGQFEYRGVKMNVREAGVKYDYASTGDSTWAILDAEAKEIAEKKKAREKFLQNIPIGGVADPDTAELIQPPVKTSSTTLAVTLK